VDLPSVSWDGVLTMEETYVYAALALASLGGILLLLATNRRGRLFLGSRGRLPKRFEVKDIPSGDIPADAQAPLDYLTEKLAPMGFIVADLPARVPALQSFGYRMVIVPFVNEDESTLFLMGIEAGITPRTDLMLHIITPLDDGRRIETTTLGPLEELGRPPKVDARVVLDAESVEEIWSRHRLALSQHQRSERRPIDPEAWRTYAAESYEGWVQSAVRAQRLQLEANGEMYRVRSRPKSIV
jgi:hypothetical protein